MLTLNILRPKENKNSLVFVTQKAFSFLKLKITRETVKELLLSHPSYPNLLSFSDILTQLQISYEAIKINEKQLPALKGSFFAHLPKHGLVFVGSITNQSVRYITGSTGWITESNQDFCEKWNGIVFIINTKNAISEERYEMKTVIDKLKSSRLPVVITLIIFLLILFVTQVGVGILISLLLTKIAGVTICSILVYLEINQTLTSSKICKIGTKMDCRSILSSPASNIFGVISMADIGLVYFTSGLVVILFYSFIPFTTSFLHLFEMIALSTLPYTLFSVYYQSFVLKKWCPLCLCIILLLWIEASAIFSHVDEFTLGSIYMNDIANFTLFSFGIAIVWSFLKEFLIERKELISHKYQFYRLIRTKEVFNVLQNQTEKIDSTFHANHISIGQADAKNELLVIINPMCIACANKYKETIDLIRRNSKKFNAKFLFQVGSINVDNLDAKVSATLIELFYHLEEEDFINAVSEWFQHRDLKKFYSKYQINYSDRSLRTLEKQFEWLKAKKIRVAPMLFYNERKLLNYFSTKELGLLV